MKAKKAIGLLVSAGVVFGSLIGSGVFSAAGSDDAPANAATVLQDFSTLTPMTYDAAVDYSDPNINTGNAAGLARIENADGSYSLGVKFGAGQGTAKPSSVQIKLTKAVPSDTKAIAVRLTMPEGNAENLGGGASALFNQLYVNAPDGNYNPYLQHSWNGYYINASMYGAGFEDNPVDCYTIDPATGTATKVTLKGTAQYEGYNFLNLNGFDGWVVIPLEYWMDKSGYGDALPSDGWVGNAAGVLYESLDPAKINAITVDLAMNEADYNPVYHEIAAVSDISAFIKSFRLEKNGKVVLQDFKKLTDISYDDDSYTDPIFLGQNNGYYDGSWHFNGLERIENADGSYSLGVQWNGLENWTNPSNVYVKFDNNVPSDTKAIAVRLTLPAGTDETAQNASSACFPYLFPATSKGTFSAYLKHYWKGAKQGGTGYDGEPVTIHRIDTTTGEKATVTLNEAAGDGKNLIFGKSAFDGWVIVPLEYWMDTTNGGDRLPNEDWVGDAKGHLYESVMPELLYAMNLGMGNSEDGYQTVYHEIAAITDMEAFLASFDGEIEITAQPEHVVVSSGDTATFRVTAASAGTIAYQWQKAVGEGEWTNIEGANAASYTTPAATAADHGTKFRCVMTTDGSALPTTTEAAVLYVDRYPDVVVDYEIGSDPIAAAVFEDAKGKNVDIIINVKDNGETAYTWKINGRDITDALAFQPEIEIKDIADTDLSETASDAFYFETKQTGKFPGKAALTVDTSFNFFEDEDLWLYSMDSAGKLTLAADDLKSGVSTSEIMLSAAGSYVLSNVEIDGAAAPAPGGPDDNNSDVADTGLNEIAGLLAVALFGIAGMTALLVKKSRKVK